MKNVRKLVTILRNFLKKHQLKMRKCPFLSEKFNKIFRPLTSSQSSETWYKLDTEPAIRQLMTQLKTNGKREKLLKKYLRNNMDDIISSILRKEKKQKKDDGEEEDEEASEEDEASAAAENGEEKMETEQNGTGKFGFPGEN